MAVEVLEVRQLLDGDPIPPPADSPIDPTTASSDATAARGALISAAISFDGTVASLEGTFNGDLTTHQTDYDDDVGDAIGIFDSAIDSINGGLSDDVDSLGNGFDLLVVGHEGTFDGDLDTANGDFSTNMAVPTSTLEFTLIGIDSAFTSAIGSADALLDNAINGPGGFQEVLDGVVDPQQTALTTNIAGHNSTFDGFVVSEQSTFDSAEGGFWSNYETMVGTGPTGLETAYNSSLTTAASTRDGVLSTYSSLTYNPSVLFGTPAYDALIAGANSTLESDLATAAGDYASNIGSRETTYNNAINGPGGAVETFNGLMDTADTNFDTAMNDADGDYDSAMQIAQGIYDTAVDFLEGTFDDNVATITGTYNDAVASAQGDRNDAHVANQTAFDDAVEAADQAYDDWINGTSASGPISVLTTVTTYFDSFTFKTRSSVVTVYTDANGVSTTTSSNSTSAVVPDGILVSSTSGTFTTDSGVTVPATIEVYTATIMPSATLGNVFLVAMKTRADQLEERLDAMLVSLNDILAGFRTTRDAAIETANGNYDAAAAGPTGFMTVYNDAVSAANSTAADTVSDAWDDYQDALDAYNQDVMTAMMNGDPMPSNTPALVATRDYQLAAAGADVTLTSDLGSALVSYVSTERGFDTTRDTDIINAISDCIEDSINAVDEYQQDAIGEVVEALNDLIDLEDGFAKADASKQKDRSSSISDAAKQFALDENTDDEILSLAESVAWQSYQKDVATEVQTFRNGEMGQRVILMQSEATAAEQWDLDATSAITDWFNAAASAEDSYTTLATNAQVIFQNGLLADYVTYTSDTTTALRDWVSTVSNGVASQYASYYGGGTDVTDVANAWRDYDQDRSAAWASFTDNDAAAFQSYGQNTVLAAQSMATNVAGANVTRAANIAGELTSYMGIVSPALTAFKQSTWGEMTTWMTSVAAEEKTVVDDSADALNSYEISLYAEVHDLGDDVAAAADDYVDNVLGDWLPYIEGVITEETDAAHDQTDELDTLLNAVRTAGTTQSQDDRDSWKTYKLGIVGSEDGLMTAYAGDLKAQGVLGAVTNFTTLAASPLSNFESQIGQTASIGMMGMTTFRPSSDDDYLAWADGITGVVNPPAPAPPVAANLRSQVEAATKAADLLRLQNQATSAFSAAQQAIRDVENSWPWGRAAAQTKLNAAMNKLNSINAQLTAMQGGAMTPQFANPGYNVSEGVVGAAQAVLGVVEMVAGAAATGVGTVATGAAPPAAPISIPIATVGCASMVMGFDQFSTGLNRLITGQSQRSLAGPMLDPITGDPATSEFWATMGSAGVALGTVALEALIAAAPGVAASPLSHNYSQYYEGMTNRQVNHAIGLQQRQLLNQWMGSGPSDAYQAMGRALPPGLTADSLRAYHELARRAIDARLDTAGTQAARLQLIEKALNALE